MIVRLAATASAAVLGASAVSILTAVPAQADAVGGQTGAECEGSSCTVSVSYTGTAAPSPGAGVTYRPTVPPTCWYSEPRTPAEMEAYTDDSYSGPLYSGKEWVLLLGDRELIEETADDEEMSDARWYMLSCRDGIRLSDPEAIAYAGNAITITGGPHAQISRLVRPGQSVPPPLVDVETLRDAAFDAMTIPDPDLDRNPTMEQGAATLVNLDTFFWAEGYRDLWDITASVGPVSATVTARSDSWTLTSPAGGTTCSHAQLTRAWSPGTTPDDGCAFPFTRSSRAYGDGFPVDVTSTWATAWTGSPDGPSTPQPLDPITTASQETVPVMESQAVVGSVR